VPDLPGAADFVAGWPGYSHWLSTSPAISIAKLRGVARGIGNEFLCACDMRFASPRARLGQLEIGYALVPGGGGLEWLPRIVGRSRALEIVLSGEDIPGTLAETYGLVNRCLPDDVLDRHVDLLARRIAGFDATALATAKRLINDRAGVAAQADLQASFAAINDLRQRDASREVYARLGSSAGTRNAQLFIPDLLG
jgi:enoyl-CoA hydratase/carnithine racemase